MRQIFYHHRRLHLRGHCPKYWERLASILAPFGARHKHLPPVDVSGCWSKYSGLLGAFCTSILAHLLNQVWLWKPVDIMLSHCDKILHHIYLCNTYFASASWQPSLSATCCDITVWLHLLLWLYRIGCILMCVCVVLDWTENGRTEQYGYITEWHCRWALTAEQFRSGRGMCSR